MAALRAILDRFRPASAPGAAGPVGVPSDRGFTAADELAPLFALLAGTEMSCSQVRADGRRRAEELRHSGTAEAARATGGARASVDHERLATMAVARVNAEREHAAILAAAQQQAAKLHARGSTTLSGYVTAAVTRVRDLATDRGPDPDHGAP